MLGQPRENSSTWKCPNWPDSPRQLPRTSDYLCPSEGNCPRSRESRHGHSSSGHPIQSTYCWSSHNATEKRSNFVSTAASRSALSIASIHLPVCSTFPHCAVCKHGVMDSTYLTSRGQGSCKLPRHPYRAANLNYPQRLAIFSDWSYSDSAGERSQFSGSRFVRRSAMLPSSFSLLSVDSLRRSDLVTLPDGATPLLRQTPCRHSSPAIIASPGITLTSAVSDHRR